MHIDEHIFATVAPRDPGVIVRILTSPLPLSKMRPQTLLTAARAMKGQYPNFELREAPGFHDRFLIIDGDDYFYLAASINDLGKKAFMFSRIEEKTVKQALRNLWNSAWVGVALLV